MQGTMLQSTMVTWTVLLATAERPPFLGKRHAQSVRQESTPTNWARSKQTARQLDLEARASLAKMDLLLLEKLQSELEPKKT
jgi:hypothetical protein